MKAEGRLGADSALEQAKMAPEAKISQGHGGKVVRSWAYAGSGPSRTSCLHTQMMLN